VAVIFSSFAADVLGELAKFQPTAEDRERLFEEMDNTSREELMQLNPEQVPEALMRRYYRQRLQTSHEFQDFVKNQHQFREFVGRFMNEAGMGGPPRPPGPPPGGRDGPPPGDRSRDRPPPPRRGEDRGPPPDRRAPQ
jgi:hypothetical protein